MSTTSTLEFSNLPTDTIEKIIEKYDLKEQLTLRKVSKDLRSLVDEQKIAYKWIEIDLTDSYISCVYNREKVAYASKNWDEEIRLGLDYSDYCILRSEDYEKIALNDVSIALNNPKLRLNVLTVSYYYNDMMNRFGLLLNSLNHQIHVKKLAVRAGSPEYLLLILPFLKPKVLVNIEINGAYNGLGWALEKVRQVTSLEQWKQAEELTARYCFDNFPSEVLMHFKRFVIVDEEVEVDFLIRLRDLFSKSTNFEYCAITDEFYLFNGYDCSKYLQSFCEKVDTGEADVLLYHYKIPDDSNKILEFQLDGCQIIIEKKNF